MGREIERKFLTKDSSWKSDAEGELYRQGYLSSQKERTVRIRVAGKEATLTIKGVTEGVARAEFEYPIPLVDAEVLLDSLCERPLIEKIRYKIHHEGSLWEVDEFLGENEGLVVAEIELTSAEQTFVLPPWIGAEVSDDPRYYNANLIAYPFTKWRK